MKRIKLNFSVLAFLLGCGLAFTTSAFKPFTNNVYNTNITNPATPNWVAIPAGHTVSCSSDLRFDCTGLQSTPGGPVTNIVKGQATLH